MMKASVPNLSKMLCLWVHPQSGTANLWGGCQLYIKVYIIVRNADK
jgi:hypothetical protein